MPGPDARVLDYGSGEALHADIVADAAGELLLCEAAPSVRAGLEKRFADNPKIRVVAPHEIARLPEHSLDLIVMHSVVQYVTPTGAGALFALFHRILKSDGLLVVSDVIQPQTAAATDALTLLRFGRPTDFSLLHCGGSRARCYRITGGCARISGSRATRQAAIIDKLDAAGFTAERAPANIGHNQERRTYFARPR